MANLTKHEGTCWTCGKEGHKSPDCPTKKSKDSPETSKKKNKDDKKNSNSKATWPEWQRTAPVSRESETSVRNRKTWMWCDTCKHWSTTHGTSTHSGPNALNAKNKASKSTEKKEKNQGNLAEIVLDDCDANNLVMGAWCGFTNEFANTTFMPVLGPTPKCADTATRMNPTLNGWMTVVPCSSKKKKMLPHVIPATLSSFVPSQLPTIPVTGVTLKPLRVKFYLKRRIPTSRASTTRTQVLWNSW